MMYGTPKPKKKAKATVKSKRTIAKPKSKRKVSPKKKLTKKKITKKLKRKSKVKKTKKTKATSKRSASTTDKVRFYDVKTKKYVKIPRSDCKIKRNRTPRGGDRLIGQYKGRELHTFVKKGFKL